LVIAHEAVDNGPNQTSLLSVGQMQHNHLQVDTTRRHTGGHQHIKDPSSGIILPLSFNRGMYRLANRITTSYEIQHLPRITLTSVSKWNPHSNDDDDIPLVPPLLSADTLTYHSQPGDSKSEGSSGLRGGLVVDTTGIEEKVEKTAKECTILIVRNTGKSSTGNKKDRDGPEDFEGFVRPQGILSSLTVKNDITSPNSTGTDNKGKAVKITGRTAGENGIEDTDKLTGIPAEWRSDTLPIPNKENWAHLPVQCVEQDL
jgi:hypothetical protein